ncbi:HEAT repeat domain-containing protein [Aquimarina litoralis]|uniref:HEAT repeat domain-containing protein n=1 Tax=Aquimarina litoralis TaxID=584605 RepID=UPI001C57544A|nr:HEAT repeat domain-containing protein [Aquimarina litoralis]MBW1296281.1 hypothetical protein [Aquimarina litoralis]
MNYFSKFNINKEDLKKLEEYQSRDGFALVEESDFNGMIEYFEQYEVYDQLIPILTDNNSNYWCFYTNGILKGLVCYVSHAELNLEPKFASISALIMMINNNPDAYDFDELDTKVFDFPLNATTTKLNNRASIINELKVKLANTEQEDIRQQLAYSIMALTSYDEIETTIYPFLDDEDMYIQERAIQMIGYHKYKAAREKLIKLTKTAMPNGKSAARKALKAINKGSN